MRLRETNGGAQVAQRLSDVQAQSLIRDQTKRQGLDRAAEQAAAKLGELPSADKKPGVKVVHGTSIAGSLPPAQTQAPKPEKSISVQSCNYRVGDRLKLQIGKEQVMVELRAINGQQVTVSELAKPRNHHEVSVDALELVPKAPLEVIERHGHLALLLPHGQVMGRGDCGGANYVLGSHCISSELQLRDVQKDAEGKLHVWVDELLGWGGRSRLRELSPAELEGLGRSNYIQKEVRELLHPIAKELQVVRRGIGAHEPSFRIGKDSFFVGDEVRVGAESAPARLLHIRSASNGAPVVQVRSPDGSARVLNQAELKSLRLDQTALDRRLPDRPSAPSFEVIRPEGGAAYLCLDGTKIAPGALLEYDRGTPGEFPVKLDRIDEHDRVWITELVPLGTVVGEHEQTVSVGGKEFRARFAGPLEELTRPISADDFSLFGKLPTPKDLEFKVYNYQDRGWAVERARSGAPTHKPLKLFQLRGETVGPGDVVIDRRHGGEKRLEIVEILQDSSLKVRAADDQGAAVVHLPVAENLFLFPAPADDLKVGGLPAHHERRSAWELTQSKILDDFAKQNPGHGIAGFAFQGLQLSPRQMKEARGSGDLEKIVTAALFQAAQLPVDDSARATLIGGPTARVVDEAERALKGNPVTEGGLTWAPFRGLAENATNLGEVFSVKLEATPSHHGFMGLVAWDEHNGLLRTFAFEAD